MVTPQQEEGADELPPSPEFGQLNVVVTPPSASSLLPTPEFGASSPSPASSTESPGKGSPPGTSQSAARKVALPGSLAQPRLAPLVASQGEEASSPNFGGGLPQSPTFGDDPGEGAEQAAATSSGRASRPSTLLEEPEAEKGAGSHPATPDFGSLQGPILDEETEDLQKLGSASSSPPGSSPDEAAGSPDPPVHRTSEVRVRALTSGQKEMAMPRRPWRRVLSGAALLALAGSAFNFVSTSPAVGRTLEPRTSRRVLAEADLSPEQRELVEHFLNTQVTDEEAKRKEKPFPFSEEELIRRAKIYLALNQDDVTAPELLAEDFEFAGPIIGPLGKAKYIEQFKSFNFREAFPDAVNEWHHFRVDPFEPNRVWFTTRGHGTNTGLAPPLITEPTGKVFENPPQACSLRFNEAGEVTQYTIGYVMDRRVGNTGGVGGLMGILYAVGKPFPYPEGQPYQPSWQRTLVNSVVEFLQQFSK
eukprot:s141_g12.t1